MSAIKKLRELAERGRELWSEVEAVLEEAAAALETISDEDAAAPEEPPASGPAPSPPAEPSGPMPEFKREYVDPQVWRAAEEDAPKVGVRPETLVAIQVWESDWYTSKLFKGANNVGGVKYRPELKGLGHVHGSYKATDGNVYAKWPTWRSGVAGHAQFLGQKRYDGIRQTESVTEEVKAIHDAGYAEHSLDWLRGVTALALRFEKERGK